MVTKAKKNLLLNPVAEVDLYDAGLAPRPTDLNDKVVGMLDNGQPFVDVFLARVAQRIQERYPRAKIYARRKTHASAPCTFFDEMVEKCDAIVAGIAL
ncbi:MAG: hypothetical protein ABIH46_13555 [Chloroflexota bacterium]